MGFSQALSGIGAASQQLDVVGNNIANSQTTGFKSSSVQFADVFANSQVGLGTRVSGVLQDFTNGNLETTGRNLDLAITGSGFFRFEQEGQVGYSRNGQLTMTADGGLVNAQGAKLMGYGLSDPKDPFSKVTGGGTPVALNVPADDMPAQATGASDADNPGVRAIYNLDASVTLGGDNPTPLNKVELRTDPADKTKKTDMNYHYSNSFTVYDSLGESHSVSLYFTKSGDNAWNVKPAIDGFYNGGSDFTLDFLSSGKLPEDKDRNVIGVNGGDATAQLNFSADYLGNGADDLSFAFDPKGTTQYANDFTQKSLTQDGYSSGSLIGISVADDGTIMRNYTNEKSMAAGKIAMANFRNPEGLKASGDNMWAATAASGAEVLGTAGVGQFGAIAPETLEQSNVDLTQELVDLIIAQRNYQANTNSIRTQSEVMDQVAQLR
ncbi:flagellar hook protein FlgE [Modicisalibacter tunisiensis]|uniref:Flagellar hook protein FlgE n=1 Tax=Modicisalibacter tunisiensis TaxID=390637 RepID=A0ABS7X050_9GAMM|nr:flagellar hook protein FlgE [Modicisalibacter tunisiensis]MBZ9568264.1 flagellar hook protein FlgE [Modicisalibacter tunisiensis]